MAPPGGDLTLQILFGRAFLLELERGDLQAATLFARAFLSHREPDAVPSGFIARAARADA